MALHPPKPPPRLPATTPNSYRIVWIGGDPLALDLDGDGLETVAANGYSGALFDHNNDGIKTATGWIAGDDGLLVRDINGDGIINNGSELFGDSTQLANGQTATQGFAALTDLDSNADGKVDASDAAFNELKIWRDINQDGISQTDELFTLDQLGIQSLNTTSTVSLKDTAAGQQILTGSFTRTDGTTSALADLNFRQDTFYSEYIDHIEIPEELQNLSNIQGMGRLRDLREAASLSPALAEVLGQYAAAETRTAQKALIDQLLLEWAKTDPQYSDTPIRSITNVGSMTYDVASTNVIYLRVGQSVTGRHEHISIPITYVDPVLQARTRIMDAILGDRTTNSLNEVISRDSANINRIYTTFAEAIYAEMLIQTRFEKYLNEVEFSITETSISLDTSKVTQMFQDRIATDPLNGLTDLIEFNRYAGDMLTGSGWDGIGLMDDMLKTGAVTPEIQAMYNELNVRFNGLSGGDGDDVIVGGTQSWALYGNKGNDILLGGERSETLAGGSGNDTLDGGAGNDQLFGEFGDDTYIFRRGSGRDTISDYQGNNRVVFTGLNPDDIIVTMPNGHNDDLVFTIKNTGDSLTVPQSYYRSGSLANSISSFIFSDGTAWNVDDALRASVAKPTEGDDTIIGRRTDDVISGLGGNDTITGRTGDDIIDGGAGDDTIIGGAYVYTDHSTGLPVIRHNSEPNGNDTYLFGRGDGHDTIIDTDKTINSDTLRFKDGIAPADVDFARANTNDLILTIKDTGDSVTIRDYFKEEGHWNPDARSNEIERIEFSDGTVWTAVSIGAILLQGTEGNDTIIGYRSDDLITGNSGDDSIDSRIGNDTIMGGDGNDTIRAGLGNDIIDGGSGDDTIYGSDSHMTWSDIGYSSPATDNDTYLFGFGDGHDTVYDCVWGAENNDTICFKEGVAASDVNFQAAGQNNTDLKIVLGNGSDTIIIRNWFYSDQYKIERFVFSDGTVLDSAWVDANLTVLGTDDNNTLFGSDQSETMRGFAGDDSLYASGGNDRLEGGAGNDLLDGGLGDDFLDGGTG